MHLSLFLVASVPLAFAMPLNTHVKREVPQEHSHEQFLTYTTVNGCQANIRTVRTLLQANNPFQIVDPVFGLLGNAAAAGGAGKVTDLDCLQQQTADSNFYNDFVDI